MPNSDDYSVSISGGSINAGNQGNIVIGAHGKIEQSLSPSSLAQPLAELQGAIEAFQGSPETREALRFTQAEIAGELNEPAPDKGKILAKLNLLKQLAGPTAAIVEAAATLAHAVGVAL